MEINKKISGLSDATLPLNDADLVEVVQGGVNKKAPRSAFGGDGGGTWGSITGTLSAQTDLINYIEALTDSEIVDVAISSGNLNLDADSLPRRTWDLTTTRASDFTITFLNITNFVRGELFLRVTGTVIIDFVSTAVVMDLFEQDAGRWNVTDKKLTLLGVTASPFYITFNRDAAGNIWIHSTNRGV